MTLPQIVRSVASVAAMLACVAFDRGQVVAQGRSGVVMGQPPRSGPRPEGAGSVRGRVVDGATGQPLRAATVSATWRALEGDGDARFSARTDAQGVFEIPQAPDGSYVVYVHRQGFHEMPGASQSPRQVTLRDGGSIDLGDVRLVRGGVLTGRVLDEHGEPVVGAMVTPIGRPRGQDMLMALGGVAVTDDRGVYRAHGLMPAKYTVRVVPPGPSGRGPVRLQGEEPELLPVFATNTPELSTAEFADVRAGEEAVLDVRVPGGRLARVTGRILSDGEPTTNSRPDVVLRPIGGADVRLAAARTLPDARFEFLDVAPGRYRVVVEEPMVNTPDGPTRRRAGWVDIAVTGEPITGVDVPIGFGAVVRGRVEIDSGNASALAERPLQVMASPIRERTPVTSGTMISTSTVDLAFEVRDLLGLMQLQIAGLPPGWWLKSVLVDGEDVFDGHLFPVSGTIDGVVLLVSSRQSGVSGRVQGAGNLQGASVLVLPGDGMDAMRGPGRTVASVVMDGTFTASGLRPGRYTLLALSPPMRSVYDRLGREERQALLAVQGRPVDVVEGRLAAVTLPLVER